jgi:RNA recognition motif-containing protein
MHIYVGNLPVKYTDIELKAMFEPFGRVLAVDIGYNKKTGESEGYGIVEMNVKAEARAAVEGLRGKELEGKPLRVRILKPDDPFHQAVKSSQKGSSGSTRFTGDVQYRGSGAIRRGGQRGS